MPQPAERLDATPEIRRNELLIRVDHLHLDSSSMHQLAGEAGGDAQAVASRIAEIVAGRGKMQNPVTGSGGIAVGRLLESGPDHPARGLAPGTPISSGISLSLTPLVLDAVHSVDIETAQVRASGKAVLFESSPFAVVPADFGLPTAMAIIDVAGAPTIVRRKLAPGDSIAVFGAGKAGLLCAAAARETLGDAGRIALFDVNEGALSEAAELGIASSVVAADLTDPIATHGHALRASAGALFDFVVNATNVAGTETASILATRSGGRILFFGMATRFAVAALSAEGAGRDVDMLIGNGFAEGSFDLAFDLVRRNPGLRACLESRIVGQRL
jgi:L-erythro-3,5-diaminohexanoate dehydrogenase